MISRHHRGNRPGRVPSTKRCLVGCLVQMVTFCLRQQSRPKRCLVGAWSCPLCVLLLIIVLGFINVWGSCLSDVVADLGGSSHQSHASSLHLRCKRIPADTSRGIPCLEFHLLFVHGPIPSADVRQVARGATPPVSTVVLAARVGRRATDDGRRTAPGKTPATRV